MMPEVPAVVKGSTILGALVLAMLVSASTPAFAQISLEGEWTGRYQEDQMDRVPGGDWGDYTGLPINEAARFYADSWDISRGSVPEHQCQVYNVAHIFRGPLQFRVWNEKDLDSQETIAIHQYLGTYEQSRTIWMDGRPHPPEYAEHTWAGFSTGRWVGNVLTVTTSHLKTTMVNRNGTATSSKATITAHFIYRENGTLMTVLSFVDDPAFYSEPLVRSRDGFFPWNPGAQVQAAGPVGVGAGGNANGLEIIDEITTWPKGYVPSYAAGTKHADWAESVGLPYEVSLGGAEQLYPEYIPKLRKLVADYQAKVKAEEAAAAAAAKAPAKKPAGSASK